MSHRDDWPEIRAHIINEFAGEQPGAPLENALIDIYTTNPAAILNAIPAIAKDLTEGRIRSGWAILRTAAIKRALQPAGTTLGREKAIAGAEQWMRNAGLHYDRWPEIHDDLFGDRGRLKAWQDTKLEERLHDLWEQTRPTGHRLDQDEHDRAQHWTHAQTKLATKPRLDPDDHNALRALALSKSTPVPHPPPAGAAT